MSVSVCHVPPGGSGGRGDVMRSMSASSFLFNGPAKAGSRSTIQIGVGKNSWTLVVAIMGRSYAPATSPTTRTRTRTELPGR